MLLRTPLTEIERLILCNILTGDRMAGVTLANQKEHDDALVSLIRRGLVSYNGHRKRQKFLVTSAGRQQMDAEAKKPDATGAFAIGREGVEHERVVHIDADKGILTLGGEE